MFSDELCRQGSVLITGGLGSIGLAIAKWMIEKHHVRHVILLGRQNADEIDKNSVRGQKLSEVLRVAKVYSASIQVIKGDVADYDQVHRIVTNVNQSEYPLRGIIHGALVIHDSLVSNMTEEILIKVLRPRVRGAWNLHEVSCKQKLDFFILLSSVRNHVVDVGGANYNASNQFFDSLAYWRYNILGVPALSISLPGVLGTSCMEKIENDQTTWYSHYGAISLETVFELIEYFHLEQYSRHSSLATPIVFAVDWNLYKNKLSSIKVARIRELVDKKVAPQVEDSQNIGDKNQMSPDAAHIDLTDALSLAVAKIFGAEEIGRIDRKKRLCEQGLDSLMAVSLHNWLNSHYSVFIPVIDIAENLSIDDLLVEINTELTNSSRQRRAITSSVGTNELANKLVFETKKTTDQLSANESPISVNYTGTSFIASFLTLSTVIDRPILFCILNIMEDSDHDNCLIAAQLASKMKRISQICLFLRQSEDNRSQMDLIEEYIKQMRRIQPRGPYYLMGYKTGTTLIREIYSQLVTYQDARVQILVLVDPLESSSNNGFHEHADKQNLSIEDTVVKQVQNKSEDQNLLYPSIQLIGTEVKVLYSSQDGNNINNVEQIEKLNELMNQIDTFF